MQVWPQKTYDGEWAANALNGRGKLLWSDGASYTGHFESGKFHGNGCYKDARNNKFVGRWKRGYRDGPGKEYDRDGGSYSGGFRKGRRHGYGRYTDFEGRLYTGGWERGMRSGRGIQLSATGDVEHCGLWEGDKPKLKNPQQPWEPQDDTNVSTRSPVDYFNVDTRLEGDVSNNKTIQTESTALCYSFQEEEEEVEGEEEDDVLFIYSRDDSGLQGEEEEVGAAEESERTTYLFGEI